MCRVCLGYDGEGRAPGRVFREEDLPTTRETAARMLAVQDRMCPETLVANTLDEEPCDGLLPCGASAHRLWRDYLRRADRLAEAGSWRLAGPEPARSSRAPLPRMALVVASGREQFHAAHPR